MVISNGAMKEVRGFEATLSVDKELKVGLISERFSLWLHNHIKSPQVKSKDYFGIFHTVLQNSGHVCPSIRDRVHRNENFVKIIPV